MAERLPRGPPGRVPPPAASSKLPIVKEEPRGRGTSPAGVGKYIADFREGDLLLHFDLRQVHFFLLGPYRGYGNGVLHGAGLDRRRVHRVTLGPDDRLLHFILTFPRLLACANSSQRSESDSQRKLVHEPPPEE